MENARFFKEKIRHGEVCLGTNITLNDPVVTEALCNVLDFVWIDMEHNPFTLKTVQDHIMATKGTTTTSLVRVAWNDPVLIKPVLDIGAAGIIVPMVRNAEDARRAVAACKYPPEGIRGYGPRRPSNYGRLSGPDFCKTANDTIIIVCQIEHIDAINQIDEILAVPGLTSIVFGPNDLSGSMGHMGEPRHPDVIRAIDHAVERARKTEVFVGIGIGIDPTILNEWMDKGVQWLSMGNDYSLMLQGTSNSARAVREHIGSKTTH